MKDVDGDLRFFGHADRELDFLLLLEAFAADVRRVVAAVGRDHPGELDDFRGMIRSTALEPRDEPPRAFFHRSRHELLHAIELGGRGGTRVVSHDDAAHLFARDV